MKELLIVIGAGVLPLVSSGTYAWAILKGGVRPQITTRFLLMVITVISFASLLGVHDRSGMWLALAAALQSVVIWALSLRRGIGSIFNALDLVCLALCALGVLLWLANGQAFIGLVASIVADFIACLPSLVKTIKLPHTEALAFYLLDSIGGMCILLASPLNGKGILYPLYIVLANLAYVVPIAWSRFSGWTR